MLTADLSPLRQKSEDQGNANTQCFQNPGATPCQCSNAVRPQVSEDHCWLSLDGSGARAAAVEVTTDTAAKRGLAPSDDAWRGWLYSGGSAVVCSPQVASAQDLGWMVFRG